MASQVEGIKWVPGTFFLVDGFRFQHPACRAYFLTHGHSDHTVGLNQGFSAGLIYCSPVTMRLLRHDMGIRADLLRPLPVDQTTLIQGVEVTPIDANHCPGAVMFLFRVPAGAGGFTGGPRQAATTILHTGDLRWHPRMAAHEALAGRPLDVLMLDTTYCGPKWTFPPQDEAVAMMAALMREEAEAGPQGAVLFVVGSYHIGKERAYLGAAAALGWRVHAAPAKCRLLRLLGLPPEWLALLTEDPEEAQVHVLGMGEQLHPQALAERIEGTRWQRVVAIRPTGWSYRSSGKPTVREEGCAKVVGVPYSEHSSYSELRDCVRSLRPRRLVPTVNAPDPARSRAIVDRFADLMDLSTDKSRLDCYFAKHSQTQAALDEDDGARLTDGAEQGGGAALIVAHAGAEAEAQAAGNARMEVVPALGDSEEHSIPQAGWRASAAGLELAAGGQAMEPLTAGRAQEPRPALHTAGQQQVALHSMGEADATPSKTDSPGTMAATRNMACASSPAPPASPLRQHASAPAELGTSGQDTADADVDLAAIDVAQQQRILHAIQAFAGRRAKRSAAAGDAALKQGTLKRFFSTPARQ